MNLNRALGFASRFHRKSVWADCAFDEDAVAQFLGSLEASEDGFLRCTDHGIIGGVLTPLWFSPGAVLATELFWYSEDPKEGRALREAFEEWASDRGAAAVQMSAQANERERALRRIMSGAGYHPTEVSFWKAL